MGRTVCTQPQCLYKGALYLYLYGMFTAVNINLHQVGHCFTQSVRNGAACRYKLPDYG